MTPIVLEGHSKHVNKAQFAPEGKLLYTLGFSGELLEWSTESWELQRQLEGHDQSVNALDFDPDGKTMYTAGTDSRLIYWDRESGQPKEIITEYDKGIHQLKVLPASGLLALSTPRLEILLYHIGEQRPLQSFAPRRKRKGLFAIGPEERQAAIGEFTGNLLILSLPDLKVKKEIDVSEEPIMGCGFLTDRTVYTIDYNGAIQIWDLDEENSRAEVRLHNKDYYFASLAADRDRLAVSHSHHLRLYQASTLEAHGVLELSVKGNYGSDFSPDGQFIALGSADGKARVWAVEEVWNEE